MSEVEHGRVWRPALILSCGLVSVLWVVSLFWGPLVPYWKQLDEAAFFALNGTLEWGGAWNFFWGHMNTRPLDIAWGILMGLPLLWVLAFDRRWPLHERLARVLLIGFSILLAVFIAKRIGGEIGRFSPSDHLRPFLNLNHLIEGLSAKTGSNDSFPGDHGVTAFVYFVGMVIYIRRLPLTLIALVVLLANTTPRLIGGGHWLSDVTVGAVGFTLLVYPLMVGTPVLTWLEKGCQSLVEKLIQPICRKLGFKIN